MRIVTLLPKVMAKSVSPYVSVDSSLSLCGLSLKLAMAQLQVGLCKIIGYKCNRSYLEVVVRDSTHVCN